MNDIKFEAKNDDTVDSTGCLAVQVPIAVARFSDLVWLLAASSVRRILKRGGGGGGGAETSENLRGT